MKQLSTIIILALSSLFFSACTESSEDIWIDVRTQEEWDSGHLEEAIHIPHEEIAARISEITSSKDATIHLYCRSGGRAGRAKSALEAIGFKNVVNDGGYEDIVKSRQEN